MLPGEVQAEHVYTFRYEMQTVDWNAGWKTVTKVVDGNEVPVQALYSDAFFAGLIMRQPMQWFVTVQESIKYPVTTVSLNRMQQSLTKMEPQWEITTVIPAIAVTSTFTSMLRIPTMLSLSLLR